MNNELVHVTNDELGNITNIVVLPKPSVYWSQRTKKESN